MAERKAYFVPTLAVYDLLLARGREWGLDDASMAKLEMVGGRAATPWNSPTAPESRSHPGPILSALPRP